MAQTEELVVITMIHGEFIAPAWREPGTVLEVDKRIADRWIAHGSAKLGGELGTVDTQPSLGSFADFPGSDKFAAAGITSVEGVKELVAAKGDAWAKEIKGITKAISAKVSEALEAMNRAEQAADQKPTEGN